MREDTGTEMDEIAPSQWTFSVNKNLIMLKLTLFFLYGATSSLIPFLPIHMRSIGLSMEEIAVIYLLLPLTTFLAPPLTGYLVDQFGKYNYKPVLIGSFLLTAILHHSLQLIPHQERPGVVPAGYVMRHPRKNYVDVWWSPCANRECPAEEALDIVLELCEDHCLLAAEKGLVPNVNTTGDPGSTDDLELHVLNGNKTVNSTMAEFKLDMHENLGDPITQIGIDVEAEEGDENVMSYKKRFKERLLRKYGINVTELEENDLRCGGVVDRANSSTKERLLVYSNDCILQKCRFRSGGPPVCQPDFKDSDDKTFWIYFVLRFTATIMMTVGVTIMDPIALAMIEKYGGDFGKERLFSSLGMALFSPISGGFIDIFSQSMGHTDYSAAFFTFDILLIITSITVFFMPLEQQLPADNIFRDLVNIFKLPQVVVFIVFLFILGNLWGFIESYLFFFLRELGAANYLLGVTVTVGTLSSLPFLYGADSITKRIGHVNIMVLAFFAHAARLLGYSMIENAWWCFPFEALESLSVHLMWVAAATYCAILAPKGLLATLIGVCGMAHYNIGRGSGSFIGGNIIGKVGIRQSCRLMCYLAFLSGCVYFLLYILWLKNIENGDKDDEEANEGESSKLANGEPKFKDQATMVSLERLCLVVEYNQIGSLSSLGRVFRTRSNSIRRGSFSDMIKPAKSSNSKTDLLKSAIEVNHSRNFKNSNSLLINANSSGKICTDTKSTPKLPRRSASLANADRDFVKFAPKETDEIVYNNEKKSDEEEVGVISDEENKSIKPL